MSADRKQDTSSGLSVGTLVIASLSSLAAALVVGRVWGGGTVIGAAITPVIVALVSEGLHRPARVVTNVRQQRTARFDPVAEGRKGVREGDLPTARPASAAGDSGERRVHRREPAKRASLPRPRRRVALAVATGLVAFVVAGVLLTGSELVFGNSAVSSSDKRTTLFGGSGASASKDDADKEKTTTEEDTPTTSTSTEDQETAPEATTPTAPAPATPPAETTPPGAAPTAPAPQSAPAPTTPAPAAPPATTTP